MTTHYGWTGRILRVDLTAQRWWTESTEPYAERFVGGIGLGLKILWDELSPGVGAFDPDNRLVFAPGPLTGTLAPGSGRVEIVSVSPRSYPEETVTRSGMGGFWGAELKFAGYDALVVEGAADRLTTLWIYDDRVELKDASALAGRDTYSTQTELRKELDSDARIACIGPAGENLSRMAVILSETSFASGRSGFGGVMGAKKLKAIAVRGTRSLRIHDPRALVDVSRKVRVTISGHRSRKHSTAIVPMDLQDSVIDRYRTRNTGCFGCPVQCFYHLDVPGSGQSAAHCLSYFYYPHATAFYGETPERDQAMADGYFLANRLGMDSFELWPMIKLLKDLYREGRITDTPELPLSSLGSRKFIKCLMECIANRTGIGDILAEGGARAADRIRDGWQWAAQYYPAYGSTIHGAGKYSVGNSAGFALLWALDSRCPSIDQHSYLKISESYQMDPPPNGLSQAHAKAIAKTLYGSEGAIDHATFDQKAEAVVYTQNRSAVINILVVCDWVYPVLISQVREDRRGDTSLESRLLAAATGHTLTEEELTQVGERMWNLARAHMVREGRSRAQDTINDVFFGDPKDGALSKSDFETAKTRYYRLRGWDEQGRPTRRTLERLGLSDIADCLYGVNS